LQADSQYIKNSNLSYYDSKDQNNKQSIKDAQQIHTINQNPTLNSKQETTIHEIAAGGGTQMNFKTENSIHSKEGNFNTHRSSFGQIN
jgi:hypothetical protein